MSTNKADFILGLFDDDDVLLKAIKNIREKKIPIHDVYCPFPVHGMEDTLGIKYTRIPRAAFLIGMTFCLSAFGFMWWVFAFDFPINFGGKPYGSFLSFIPPTFEATVLGTSIGMAVIYFTINWMVPAPKQHPVDLSATSDRFVLAINKAEISNVKEVSELLRSNGAVEIKEKEIILDKSLKKAV